MVMLHAFQLTIFHYQIMIESISEVICKGPWSVLYSLSSLCLVLFWAFRFFNDYTYCFVQEGLWSYKSWASRWSFGWKVMFCMYVSCWGTDRVDEIELLDDCGRIAAGSPRTKKACSCIITRVAECLQTFYNKCLTVRFEVLRITVFGMWHCIIRYKFTCVLENPADSTLRIFF